MAIWTQEFQIADDIVSSNTIDVIYFKYDWLVVVI